MGSERCIRDRRKGLRGIHVEVETEEQGVARHLHDIEEIIEGSGLPAPVQARSLSIFRRLAEAEARVHGTPVDHVHFHEVGALDAIVDVVGAVTGFWLLGVERAYASHVHVGRGTITCAHGVIPVPAPATAELLKGVPIYGRDVEAELVTPTGAAILASLAAGFGPGPAMRVDQIGYGAGTRELPLPNLLRISIGETLGGAEDGEEAAEAGHGGHGHHDHHGHEHGGHGHGEHGSKDHGPGGRGPGHGHGPMGHGGTPWFDKIDGWLLLREATLVVTGKPPAEDTLTAPDSSIANTCEVRALTCSGHAVLAAAVVSSRITASVALDAVVSPMNRAGLVAVVFVHVQFWL